jgi:hypothetical protein
MIDVFARCRRTRWMRRSIPTGATRGSFRSATWAKANAPALKVVSHTQFGFTHAETASFEAQLLLDCGQLPASADRSALSRRCSPRQRRLCSSQWPRRAGISPDVIVPEFVTRFVEPKIFWDTYHAGQFANYLINRHEGAGHALHSDTVHKLVEEANLFIDAAYKASAKYQAQQQKMLGGESSPST